MKLKKYHWIAILLGISTLLLDAVLFLGRPLFFFIIGLSLLVIAFPFIFDIITRVSVEKEKEEMFLEFLSDLAEAVKTGIPLTRAIINVSKRDYKSLDHHVKKLANQITIGTPITKAFEIFARDTRNIIIARAVELISQAERAGGKIESIFEATVNSVREIEDIKKKREASVHSMVMQGYIIFFVFLIIMVIVQVKFIPVMIGTLQSLGQTGYQTGMVSVSSINVEFINTIVLILIMLEGVFAGLFIGKISEGRIVSGIKHTFILLAISFLILQGAKILAK